MPESGRRDIRNYSIFDKMSTEALEEILRADSRLTNDEDSDMDAILYIMEVVAKREKEHPTGRFTDFQTAWTSFNDNYKPYINDDKSLYDFENINTAASSGIEKTPFTAARRKHFKRSRRGLSRAACIAAVIAAVLLAGTLTASAFGYDLWGAVAQWTRDTFGFSTVTPAEDTDAKGDYSSIQEALDDYGIEVALAPTWIPDGYSLYSVDISETPVKTVFFARYQKGNEELSISITNIGDGADSTFEKDGSNVIVYESNGIEHYIMSNIERIKVVWLNGKFECAIAGNISLDDLEQMVNSIYER